MTERERAVDGSGEAANITFVGPTIENLNTFADKTSARQVAIEANVPVVPGTDGAVTKGSDAVKFVEENGLPVIIKAAMGGGGKGMVRLGRWRGERACRMRGMRGLSFNMHAQY